MAFQAIIVFTLACLCVPCDANRKFIEIDRSSNDVPKGKNKPVFQEQWITQKLDHFNGADSRVWDQVSSDILLYSYSHCSIWRYQLPVRFSVYCLDVIKSVSSCITQHTVYYISRNSL